MTRERDAREDPDVAPIVVPPVSNALLRSTCWASPSICGVRREVGHMCTTKDAVVQGLCDDQRSYCRSWGFRVIVIFASGLISENNSIFSVGVQMFDSRGMLKKIRCRVIVKIRFRKPKTPRQFEPVETPEASRISTTLPRLILPYLICVHPYKCEGMAGDPGFLRDTGARSCRRLHDSPYRVRPGPGVPTFPKTCSRSAGQCHAAPCRRCRPSACSLSVNKTQLLLRVYCRIRLRAVGRTSGRPGTSPLHVGE